MARLSTEAERNLVPEGVLGRANHEPVRGKATEESHGFSWLGSVMRTPIDPVWDDLDRLAGIVSNRRIVCELDCVCGCQKVQQEGE